ncbi:MAG: chemotaxis protein CheD [Deltaproteobacteria bacterium]|nr:chemotaxis protein CheD [Deltaproteobacteria bacterium]
MQPLPMPGIELEIGSCTVAQGDDALFIAHLASGVALCVHDGGAVAGVAYALRGRSTADERAAVVRPALFVDLAVAELLRLLDERGARPSRRAIIVGGAVGPGWRRPREVALEAIAVARDALRSNGVPIVHEVLGGSMGRRLVVYGQGTVRVDSARDPGRVLRFDDVAGTAGGGA